jgi:hypothetical protein
MGRTSYVKLKRRFLGESRRPGKVHRKKIRLLCAILLTGVFATACASNPLRGGTATGPVITSPVDTPAAVTPLPTMTPAPTATETATFTAEPPSASPTSALVAACIGAPATISPDGQWVFCDAKDAKGLSIPYAVSASGKRWDGVYKKIAGAVPVYEDNKVLTWTPDDRYVYVILHGITTGVGRFFYAGSDVWRMDLSDGSIQDLLPLYTFESNFYDLAISPDGRRLATVDQWMTPLMLEVFDLPSDKRTEIKLADTKVGNRAPVTAGELFWTPDGKKLIYKMITVNASNQCAYVYSIQIMDLGNQSTQTVVGDHSIALCNGAPEEYHVLQVDDQGILLELKGARWRYDIATNKLELQASQTATP